MTKNIIAINSNESVLDACKKYAQYKVGSLVVKNNDMIVGIVTERDIIENLILVEGNPKKLKVSDIMTPRIKTVHALAKVEKAASIMKENNIKKLPVVLNNEIVGIITETDLTRTIHAFSEAIDELTQLYYDSKDSLEKMIDDWGNVIVSLKNYKKLTDRPKERLETEEKLV